MSWKSKIILMLLLAGTVVLQAAAVKVMQFGSIKVSVSFVSDPQVVRGSGGKVYGVGGTAAVNRRWLAIQVSFVPGVSDMKDVTNTSGNAKVVKALAGRWIDDPVMHVYVIPESKGSSRVMFEGKTEFWTVRLDGRRHNATMFIPPQLLDRYGNVVLSQRREKVLAANQYKVLVEFTDSSGKSLGRALGNVSGRVPAGLAMFEELKKSTGVDLVKNGILPRNKSPWQWHEFSTYDYVKDTGNATTGSGNQ